MPLQGDDEVGIVGITDKFVRFTLCLGWPFY